MSWQLVVVEGADRGRFFVLPDEGTVTIGTNRKHADIAVNDLYVARIHCEVVVGEGNVEVRATSSEHKVLVSNKAITEAALPPGEVLRLGNTQFRLIPYDPNAVEPEPAEDEEGLLEVEILPDEDEPSAATTARETKQAAVTAAKAPTVEAAPAIKSGPLPNLWLEDLPQLSGYALSHYHLGKALGTGPCSVVFRARDTKTGLHVAMRVFPPTFPINETEMQRFVQALRVVLPLRHRHLIALWNAGRTVPYCWVAMDLVEGPSLAEVLGRLQAPEPEGWKPALRLGVHLLRALNYVHHHRLAHGSVTPRNILLRQSDNIIKLGDLMLHRGLAGSALEAAGRAQRLEAELPYFAPEELDPNVAVTIRTDVYSAAACMYARITGHPPFEGATEAETTEQILTAPLPLVSQYGVTIPDAFEEVLITALSRRPEDRYPTPGDMLADLESIAETYEVEV
jgi:serine/threonine-protein kinase